MIGISRLYCQAPSPSDSLRYGPFDSAPDGHARPSRGDRRPVVVWNLTRRCNLNCFHCYARAQATPAGDELSTAEGQNLIDDLAAYGVPVLLFSGGEPLLRPDLVELAAYAVDRGLRAVVSTNGTLLTPQAARALERAGVSYVGVSLDGLQDVNDRLRGAAGAFTAALEGIDNGRAAGLKVGLRITLCRSNRDALDGLFDLVATRAIARVCFYHLVFAGRGRRLAAEALSPDETRETVDRIVAWTAARHAHGAAPEVLTVDNHADGPYIYLKLLAQNPQRASRALALLQAAGGNSSGVGIGCVGWSGTVHADQFWRHYSFGNVRRRPFSQIWSDTREPLMQKLKAKARHVTGRCAACRWIDICGGNFRVRAEALTGDTWAPDPACYLTDAEIA